MAVQYISIAKLISTFNCLFPSMFNPLTENWIMQMGIKHANSRKLVLICMPLNNV